MELLESRYLPSAYVLTELTSLGGSTQVFGLNNQGNAVGISNGQAVLWREDGEAIPLGINGTAYSINNLNQVVGWASADAFIWSREEQIAFLPSLDAESKAFGINDEGTIVGWVGKLFNSDGRSAQWTNDGRTVEYLSDTVPSAAYAINNRGVVVGQQKGQFVIWAGGNENSIGFGLPMAVNEAGEVVGGVLKTSPLGWTVSKAFSYQHEKGISDIEGSLCPIGFDIYSSAADVNKDGEIAGYSGCVSLSQELYTRAVVRKHERWIDLNKVTSNMVGWFLMEATAINDEGTIVGWGIKGNQLRAFRLEETEMKMSVYNVQVEKEYYLKKNPEVVETVYGTIPVEAESQEQAEQAVVKWMREGLQTIDPRIEWEIDWEEMFDNGYEYLDYTFDLVKEQSS